LAGVFYLNEGQVYVSLVIAWWGATVSWWNCCL